MYYYNNPIDKIFPNTREMLSTLNKKVKIVNKFRELYYSLKFKKRLRDWLWVRIRKPKIEEKYSHDYLIKNLPDEDADLDEVLAAW
jgi:hypothetical protein